jgi:hypothetical protein
LFKFFYFCKKYGKTKGKDHRLRFFCSKAKGNFSGMGLEGVESEMSFYDD